MRRPAQAEEEDVDGMQEKGEWGREEAVDEGSFDEGVCHIGLHRDVVLVVMD